MDTGYIITPPGMVQVHLTASVDLGGLNHVKSKGDLLEGEDAIRKGKTRTFCLR